MGGQEVGKGSSNDVPGLSDKNQDLGPSCEGHPGGQERALGLRSHGYWAGANLAPCRVSIPESWAPAPNMVVLASGTLNRGGRRGSSGTNCLPTKPRALPKPWQRKITSTPPGPQAARASPLPTVCPLLSVAHIGLNVLRTGIASLPAGKNQSWAGWRPGTCPQFTHSGSSW